MGPAAIPQLSMCLDSRVSKCQCCIMLLDGGACSPNKRLWLAYTGQVVLTTPDDTILITSTVEA